MCMILVASVTLRSMCQVECKRAEPKDAASSQLTGATAAAGGAMILAQAADGTVGLVPASALQASASLLQSNAATAAMFGPAAAAGGFGLLSPADLSAAAAAYRPRDLLQPSVMPAGKSPHNELCLVGLALDLVD